MIAPLFTFVAAFFAAAVSGAAVPSADVSFERRAANGIEDPGVFPHGKKSMYTSGWDKLIDVKGAKIDNSTFKFGKHGARLVAYVSEKEEKSKIKRAVIAVHGDYRDPWNQFIYVNKALQNAVKDGGVKEEEVSIVAPFFASQKDQGAYSVDKNGVSNTKTLIWDQTTWGDGSDAIYPSFTKSGELNNTAYHKLDGTYQDTKHSKKHDDEDSKHNKKHDDEDSKHSERHDRRSINVKNSAESQRQGPHVSPFDVLDKLIEHFLDKKQYPNLVTVVVSGFSLGAQLTQRYIALRKDAKDTRVNFGVNAPGTFMYISEDRIDGADKCDGYNNYKYGLGGELPTYVSRNKVDTSSDAVMDRYFNATTYYMVGANDDNKGDTSCQANAQGKDHLEKMVNWVRKILPKLHADKHDSAGLTKDGIPKNTFFTTISGVSHQAYGVYLSKQGTQMLFLDDYDEKGKSAKGDLPLKPGADNDDEMTPEGKSKKKHLDNDNAATLPTVSVPVATAAMLFTAAVLL